MKKDVSGRLTGLSDVRALTFDIFGTTVDWRSGVSAEARRQGMKAGVQADWEGLADAWRGLYMPSMNRVRSASCHGLTSTAFIACPWTRSARRRRRRLRRRRARGAYRCLGAAATMA